MRNGSDFPLLRDCPNCTPFQRLTRPTLFSSPVPGFSSFCLHIRSSFPLFERSQCTRPFLVASKLDDTRKFTVPFVRFHSLSRSPRSPFTILLPLYLPVLLSAADRRRPKFGTRAEPAILFHIERIRAPPRGITYEKRRNPPPPPPSPRA